MGNKTKMVNMRLLIFLVDHLPKVDQGHFCIGVISLFSDLILVIKVDPCASGDEKMITSIDLQVIGWQTSEVTI